MMRSVDIENGIVVNIMVGHTNGYLPIDDSVDVKIGDIYDGENFTRPVESVEDQKTAIINKIDGMERQDLMNRGIREMSLYLLHKEAAAKAIELGAPITAELLLAQNAFYVKLKARDDEVTALRLQLFALG